MLKLVAPLLAVSILLNIYLLLPKKASDTTDLQTVAFVKDGDTFETTSGLSVRFDTLDAPEITNCGGLEAKKALENLILNKKVKILTQAKDNNRRAIATVYLENLWVDEMLLKTGWVAYSSTTVDKDHILKNLDTQNKKNQIGIYSSKCTQYSNPDNPKCNIKGNIVNEWEFKGDKVYHFPGCKQYATTRIERYRGEQWFCTEKEAIAAGYTKSGGCK